jgi:hypothetical protein
MNNRYIVLFFPIVLIMIFSGCQKDVFDQDENLKYELGRGVTLNKNRELIDLPSVSLAGIESLDTIEYNGSQSPFYEIRIEGGLTDLDRIEPGTIMYLPSGSKGGILIFIIESETADRGVSLCSDNMVMTIRGFQTTPDMYFNYENAVLEFCTSENRSKKNSGIANKLVCKEYTPSNEKLEFIKEFSGLEFSSVNDTICELNISGNIWESGNSFISVYGSLAINPSIDLYLRYEPELKTGQEFLELPELSGVPIALIFPGDKESICGELKRFLVNIYFNVDRRLDYKIHLTESFDILTSRVPLGNCSHFRLFLFRIPLKVALDS